MAPRDHPISSGPTYLRLSQAAARLGISTRTAYRWAEAGAIPVVDRGGPRGRYVPLEALEAFLAAESSAAIDNLEPRES